MMAINHKNNGKDGDIGDDNDAGNDGDDSDGGDHDSGRRPASTMVHPAAGPEVRLPFPD